MILRVSINSPSVAVSGVAKILLELKTLRDLFSMAPAQGPQPRGCHAFAPGCKVRLRSDNYAPGWLFLGGARTMYYITCLCSMRVAVRKREPTTVFLGDSQPVKCYLNCARALVTRLPHVGFRAQGSTCCQATARLVAFFFFAAYALIPTCTAPCASTQHMVAHATI